jgi:predicted nucleic acid-binding protein
VRSYGSAGVFVDTSAFFALANIADQNHGPASAAMVRFREDRRRLLTSNFIVAETHALLLGRLGYTPAAEFLRVMEQSRISVERITATDES